MFTLPIEQNSQPVSSGNLSRTKKKKTKKENLLFLWETLLNERERERKKCNQIEHMHKSLSAISYPYRPPCPSQHYLNSSHRLIFVSFCCLSRLFYWIIYNLLKEKRKIKLFVLWFDKKQILFRKKYEKCRCLFRKLTDVCSIDTSLF